MRWLDTVRGWLDASQRERRPNLEPGSDDSGSSTVPWFKQAAVWLRERDKGPTIHLSEHAGYAETDTRFSLIRPDIETGEYPALTFDSAVEPLNMKDLVTLPNPELEERKSHVEELLKKLEGQFNA